jgi:hypothetical protein
MNPAGFNPQHQTHPLDRAATGIDSIEISGDFF